MAREGNDGTLAVATLNLKVFAVLVWCVLNPFHVSKAFLRDFGVNATLSQDLKSTIEYYAEQTTTRLTKPQKEALDMICSKIARICVGNNNEIDHWRDIAGYALLVVRELEREYNECDGI